MKIINFIYATELSLSRRIHEDDTSAYFWAENVIAFMWGNFINFLFFSILWVIKVEWFSIGLIILPVTIPWLIHGFIIRKNVGLYDKLAGEFKPTRMDRNLFRALRATVQILSLLVMAKYVIQASRM